MCIVALESVMGFNISNLEKFAERSLRKDFGVARPLHKQVARIESLEIVKK